MRNILRSSFLAFVLLSAGCAARVASTPTVPGRAATPLENVLAWNAALANANLGVAQNVVAAQNANTISVDTANRVLTAQSMIADGDRQLTFVLQSLGACLKAPPVAGVSSCKASLSQTNGLIAQIGTAANNLVVSGDLGIKDANTTAAITSSMKSIFALAQQIVGALQAGGLLQ